MAITYLEKQPSNTWDVAHTFSLTLKLTSPFFEKICMFRKTFPTKQGLPCRIRTQSPCLPNIAQWVHEGEDVGKDAGDNAPQEEKTIFGTEIFFTKVSSQEVSFCSLFRLRKGGRGSRRQ